MTLKEHDPSNVFKAHSFWNKAGATLTADWCAPERRELKVLHKLVAYLLLIFNKKKKRSCLFCGVQLHKWVVFTSRGLSTLNMNYSLFFFCLDIPQGNSLGFNSCSLVRSRYGFYYLLCGGNHIYGQSKGERLGRRHNRFQEMEGK